MAMTNCAECGQPISDKAPACPHCGFVYQKKATPSASSPIGCGTIILALCILFGISICGLFTDSSPSPPTQPAQALRTILVAGCDNGRVIVPHINLFSKPGGIAAGAKVVGSIPLGDSTSCA